MAAVSVIYITATTAKRKLWLACVWGKSVNREMMQNMTALFNGYRVGVSRNETVCPQTLSTINKTDVDSLILCQRSVKVDLEPSADMKELEFSKSFCFFFLFVESDSLAHFLLCHHALSTFLPHKCISIICMCLSRF